MDRQVDMLTLGIIDEKENALTYGAVAAERLRAHALHDHAGRSMERAEWWDKRWLPVLVEEVGEVARALCEAGKHTDPTKLREKLEEELIQVAAMACAWIQACNDCPPQVNNPLYLDDGMDGQ